MILYLKNGQFFEYKIIFVCNYFDSCWLAIFLYPKTNNHESHQLVLNRDSQLFLGFVAYSINVLSKSKDLQVRRDLVLIFD